MIKFFDIEVESWIKVECMLFLADMMIVIASCIILRSALAVYFDMISEHIRAIVASSLVINCYSNQAFIQEFLLGGKICVQKKFCLAHPTFFTPHT